MAFERAMLSGDIFASSSLKFLATVLVLMFEHSQMFFVQLVSFGNEFAVPVIVPDFVSADEQDRRPAWVEGEGNPVGFTAVLSSQLLHVREFRGLDAVDVRPTKCGAALAENFNRGTN